MAAEQGRSGVERHIQSGVLVILTGLMAWTGKTLVDVNTRTAVIEADLASLKAAVQQAYSASAAIRDQTEITRRLDRFETRLDRLEQQKRDRE
jgi:hypothetical protein